jgi:hypothetical protein
VCRQDGPRDDTSAPKRKPPIKKRAKPRSLKEKGRGFEFWTRRATAEAVGFAPDCIQTRGQGATGWDLLAISALRKKFPFSVECKAQGGVRIYDAMKQARHNTPEGYMPLEVCSWRGQTIACLPVAVFFSLVRTLNEANPEWADWVLRDSMRVEDALPKISDGKFEIPFIHEIPTGEPPEPVVRKRTKRKEAVAV